MLASVETAKVLSSVGFDWFFLDNEHSPLVDYQVKTLRPTGGMQQSANGRSEMSTSVTLQTAAHM